ncbi:NUDIX domain-containing protein [Lichenicoccus sp.]|uniref:NUDIX domain-containing protein n=1 Tax=Lichenicoccus sp. TaxID=2781899 RepID=UPI003D11BE1A
MTKSEITTLSSRIAYENKWLRLREDIIRRPDGAQGLYGVVERDDFVVVAALGTEPGGAEPGDDGPAPWLAMVQQYRYPVRQRLWELPMGMWEERAGATPETIAAGELREETGLVAGRMQHAGVLFQGAGYSNQKGHVFLATDLEQQSPMPESTEQDMITRRIPLDEVEAMIRDGRITCMVSIAAFGMLRLKGLL